MTAQRPETVPAAIWASLCEVGIPHRLEEGQLLWQPGDKRTGQAYLVVSGLIRLFHPSRNSRVVTLLAISPGGILGHHANPAKKTYGTGAEAMCASRVLSVPSEKLEALLICQAATHQPLVAWYRNSMFQQLAETNTRLELEHDNAKVKVAHVLLCLNAQGMLERVDRQTIAELANMSVETAVRQISQLVREGVLSGSHFSTLASEERQALAVLLEPYEPSELPYG